MASRAPSDRRARGARPAPGEARRAWYAAGLAGAALLVWLGGCRADDLLNPRVPDVGAEGPLPQSAERLEFAKQPEDIPLGGTLAPIEVVARDEDGRVATGFHGIVSVAVEDGPDGVTLRGTTGRPAVAGVAAFTNLTLDRQGRFRLEASAAGVRGAVSESFDVSPPPGRPARLVQHNGDSQTDTINATLGEPYVVRVLDERNNPVSGVTIRWLVESGGGGVAPQSSMTNGAGEASTRHTLGGEVGAQRVQAIVQENGEIRLAFTAAAVHGAPASLTYAQQPSDTEEDERIRPPVVVAALDRLGNRATRSNAEVSMSLVVLSGPPSARLRGGAERRLENGVAIFESLRIDRSGSAFLLRARAGGLTIDSQPFRVHDD